MRSVVYFIEDPETGLIKIGYTGDLKVRLKALIREIGRDLHVLATSPGDRDDEQFFHGLLKEHRSHGEWFRPNVTLTCFIDFARKLEERVATTGYADIWGGPSGGYWRGWEGF